MESIGILGGGNFGTALAQAISNNGFKVYLWMRNIQNSNLINQKRENEKYLKGIKLNHNIFATSDIKIATNPNFIIIALPSKILRNFLIENRDNLKNKLLVSTTKSLEEKSFLTMTEIIEQIVQNSKVGAISGPNIAREIAENKFTATVIASKHDQVKNETQKFLHSNKLRVYKSLDVVGVQISGALKNIYAIIIGIADACGAQDNTKSAIITRALAEITRFATFQGADPITFLGLAGVGDLMLTCYSVKSRNFRLGKLLGSNVTLDKALDEIKETAEGINTLKTVIDKSERDNIYMPLATSLYNFINKKTTIEEIITSLTKSNAQYEIIV